MTPPPSDPLIGYTLDGRYAIHSRIARGGMAVVYRGLDTRLHRQVALKVMHGHLAEDPEFRKRFEQEARNAAGLNHSNLVNVFDQGEEAGYVYLVMEYLPGITLRQLLKQQRRLTIEQAIEISEAILAGLSAAHNAGIIHRDLKPENVLLADDGRIKLGDFGLARAASAHTTTGQALLGTIAYLSPELVTRGIADARSDIYAFGIMLFEMVTGVQPFVGEQPMQIAYQHAHDAVPLPSTISSESNAALDEVVRWSTTKDPDDRPRNAGELLGRLHALTAFPESPLAETRILHTHAVADLPTASTTVLTNGVALEHPEDATQEVASEIASVAQTHDPPPHAGVSRAQHIQTKRKRMGWSLFSITVLLAVAAGAVGWWFGQGPGAEVAVPDVVGEETSSAISLLESLEFSAEVTECPHVTIPVGHVTETTPQAGARVERETRIQLCESTGPRILAVPMLVGLTQSEAEAAIVESEFVLGSIVAERFDATDAGIVLAALTDSGEALGETYYEQGSIDLVISAGPIPNVAEHSVEDATNILQEAGLEVDSNMNSDEYSDQIAKGQVISLNIAEEPLELGDSVGLHISLGPQLFEVPDVSELRSMKEALQVMRDAGFEPTTVVPEAFQGAIRPAGSTPEAGEFVPRGTQVTIYPRFID